MFRSTVTATIPPTDTDVMDPADLVPLSVLALDVEPSSDSWIADLEQRGIAVMIDDLGRDSITRADARRLITERRAAEARAREVAERNERNAIELDQQWRAQLSGGVPWYAIPHGVSPAQAMMQAGYDAERPRRRTLLDDALAHEEGLVYHSLRDDEHEA